MADLFDVVVARKLSGGGGGGGSSDFSTATVTVSGGNLLGALPFIMTEEQGGMDCLFIAAQSYAPGAYSIALYKGMAALDLSGVTSVSGNIEDVGGGFYFITGDCTITIS